ncbi:hypothetical protein [Catenuloplanes indicus]|uniref:Uncharacterized protein n=1 Tax=Catenuloplanes indicus TaxID=137267 RepID=A0AAE3W7N8_9ACTN|nr:hypothetical protein [Catenuloplanes indicus]MDQ0370812.1 hypothetical protein [Catenuloplanes indicus]
MNRTIRTAAGLAAALVLVAFALLGAAVAGSYHDLGVVLAGTHWDSIATGVLTGTNWDAVLPLFNKNWNVTGAADISVVLLSGQDWTAIGVAGFQKPT